MDEADISQQRKEREDAIRARVKPDLTIPFSDACLNCGEETKAGRRWCDSDCRADWNRRN